MSTDSHLAKAKDYIAKGEDYYRKAADEIVAARKDDPQIGWREIASGVGMSYEWCRELVQWRTSVKDPTDPPFGGPDKNAARYDRQARTILKDPERRGKALADLPTGEVEEVIKQAHSVVMDRVHAKQAEMDATPRPTVRDLMGADPFNPGESWIDSDLLRLRKNAHMLRLQYEKWGLVIGSMSEEKVFAYLQEAEHDVATVRAALQERMTDSRIEV